MLNKIASSQPEELRASQIASTVSVGMAILKLGVGVLSGSLSLIASGIDSIFDAIASGVGYVLLKMSLEPADAEHPYGHSRIESMASLAQGVLLLGIAIGLTYAASTRFDLKHEPHALDITIVVPLICTFITLALWLYMGRVVKNTGSSVVAGDRLHYFTDLAGNILLVVGFLAARIWKMHNVDAILTLILCLFILYGGVKIIIEAVKELVDHSDPAIEKEIILILKNFYPEALGASRIRSRRSGRRTAMDIELLSCRLMKFQDVHDISHKVQKYILKEKPHLDIIIHSEPCHHDQCATDSQCQYQTFSKGEKK